jgi:hypothetical protein
LKGVLPKKKEDYYKFCFTYTSHNFSEKVNKTVEPKYEEMSHLSAKTVKFSSHNIWSKKLSQIISQHRQNHKEQACKCKDLSQGLF